MAYDAHANFGYGTILTAPSPATSGTTATLNSGQGTNFPAVPFNAVVWPINAIPLASNAEIVRVTAMTGDSITAMTRAQESSTARSIAVGDQIAASITKKILTDIENGKLEAANNLSDLANAGTARTNLGLGSVATHAASEYAPSSGIAESATTGLVSDLALAFKRAFILGKAGAIGVTETDCADFVYMVPWDCTIQKMKVTLRGAATGAMVVQLRKAAGPITTAPTYSDVSGFSVTFSSSNVAATSDPADANLSEGDVLGFSVSTGSGTDMFVEVTAVPR